MRGEYSVIGSANIIVVRDRNHAIAIDSKTKQVIARSTDHASVIQAAINALTNK